MINDSGYITAPPANDTTTTNMTQAVTVPTQTAGSDSLVIANTKYVDNQVRDSHSPAYTITAVSGTATVSRSYSDVYYREFVTTATGTTTLAFDTSTFPTNGGTTIAWGLNPDGNTISVDATSVDTSSWASVTLVTNAMNDLIFRKKFGATLFKVQGE